MLTGYFVIGAMNSTVGEPFDPTSATYADFSISLQSWDYSSGSVSWAATSQSGDTATAGADYQALSGSVTLGPGHLSESIHIPILFDTVVEPSETFRVVLSNPSSGFMIMQSSAVVTIAADNPIYVSIFAGPPGTGGGNEEQLLEGQTGEFRVTRSRNDIPLVVYLEIDPTSTASSGDYSPSQSLSSVNFAVGQSEIVINILAIQDALLEPGELLKVNIASHPTGGQGPVP